MNNLINQLNNLTKCAPTLGPVLKELSEEIDRLELEVAKLRKLTEWQPIETVPSGDVILYYPKQTGRNALSEWIRTGTPADTPRRKPTHWIPLPKPPAVEGE